MPKRNACDRKLMRQNLSNAKLLYPGLPKQQLALLRDLTASLHLSIFRSELLHFSGKWYVSHSGLLRIESPVWLSKSARTIVSLSVSLPP